MSENPPMLLPDVGLFGPSIDLLSAGDVLGAADSFRATIGLNIAGAESPAVERAGTLRDADVALLVEVLRAAHPEDVSWWRAASERWQQLAMTGTSRACAMRGRRLAAAGSVARWDDLAALSMLARATAQPSGSAAPARNGSRAPISPEPRADKTQRMLLLFGRGDRARVNERMERLRKEPPGSRDLPAILLCLTGERRVSLSPYSRVEMWQDAGEHRAAIEEFLAAIGETSLANWVDDERAQMGAYLCGLSLLATGDAVSAYACFYLATLYYKIPEGAAPDASSSDFLRLAATEAERLAWAAGRLHEVDARFSIHPRGWRMLSWFSEHGLAGRWGRYPVTAGAIQELYPVRTSRALASVARRNGWLLPRLTELPHLRPSERHLRAPSALPAAVAREPARPCAPAPLSSVVSPPHPMAVPITATDVARFRIGFMKGTELRHREEDVRLEAGHVGLALTSAVDDQLITSVARQLTHDGWNVLWLRRPSPRETPSCVEPASSEFVRIRPGGEFSSLARGFLADLAADDMLRKSVAARMVAAVDGGTSPTVHACMNALLMRAHRSDLWNVLTSAKHGRSRAAARIVSDEAMRTPRSPQDLRRCALLVRIMTRAAELLAAALRITCIRPESTVKRLGMLVDLPGSAAPAEALLGLLAAGSMLRSAEHHAEPERDQSEPAPITDLDDFELSPRPRPPGLSNQRARALLDRARRAEEQPPSPWQSEGLLASDRRAKLCILASETLGNDWPVIARWIRSGRFAQRHVLLGGCRNAHPAVFTHEMIGQATLFLLGPLDDEARARFQIATGMSPGDAVGRSNEVQLLHIGPAVVERRQVMLWPQPE